MAAITGNFLAWEFELKDEAGNTMALIDRWALTSPGSRRCRPAPPLMALRQGVQ